MRRKFRILLLVLVAAIFAILFCVIRIDTNKGKDTSTTTMTITTTTKTTTTTEENELEEVFFDPEVFKETDISLDELSFEIKGVEKILDVKLYSPIQTVDDDEVYDNSYIIVKILGSSLDFSAEFEKTKGVYLGNIVPKDLTYLYVDGKYNDRYGFLKEDSKVVFSDFGEVKRINIRNRMANPIISKEIAGNQVVVNNMIFDFVNE